jgi:hypothetical protein
MKKEKLNGGSAIGVQVMLLIFFLPFIVFLAYIIFSNFSLEGLTFLIVLSALITLIIRNAFSYADIYIHGNTLLLKKLFYSNKKSVKNYKALNKALLPFTYFIEFDDYQRVYFFLQTSEVIKEAFSLDPDQVLKRLRSKFQELKLDENITG